MYLPDLSSDTYVTPEERRRRFERKKLFKGPFWFYVRYCILVINAGIQFLFTKNPQAGVTLEALRMIRILENQGADFTCEGLNRYPAEKGPYVFACNHMGTMEPNVLPGLVASKTPMTFVVKTSLMKVPFFGRILRRLQAIPVDRKHPGEDLVQVLQEGERLLAQGTSVILFPEGTRQKVFSPKKFNSLAVKLALRAGVPVVPVAVKTDFWGDGQKIKDFGPLHLDKKVHISFGEPLQLSGRGKAEHHRVVEYISSHLKEWGADIEEA